jgi:D-ribose pyranase
VKRGPILHAELSAVIAALGHGDMLVIGDAGLPIPAGTRRIDLAVSAGVPNLEQVLRAVLAEMQVERARVSSASRARSPEVEALVAALLPGTPIARIAHEALKGRCRQAVAVVRTGEFTPYANVVLVSGVLF